MTTPPLQGHSEREAAPSAPMGPGPAGRAPTVALSAGARVLTETGVEVVAHLQRHGVLLDNGFGGQRFVPHTDLQARAAGPGGVQAVHQALEPWWSSLSPEQLDQVQFKAEVVWEVEIGTRAGHLALASEGEPFYPFGPGYGVSLRRRCEAMAAQLTYERAQDRKLMRRVAEGEIAGPRLTGRTVQNWVTAYRERGLPGLEDQRSRRPTKAFADLPSDFLRIAEEELGRFDGTISATSRNELERRILLRLRTEHDSISGPHDEVPERLMKEYLSARTAELGRTTRQHRSHHQRTVSATTSYPAIHPSHMCMDGTWADNLVYDELHERVHAVEVLSCLSVAARTVHGLRVTPRSSNGIDAGLVLYDVLRPHGMHVDLGDGEVTIDDWRWVGVPESLDLTGTRIHTTMRPLPLPLTGPLETVEGEHNVPGIAPTSLRVDHGSIFVGTHFRALLDHFGIDLLLSRGSKPTDNPVAERWHEVLQRAYQMIPGYKGRAVYERGRFVGVRADQPLLTAAELQAHLRRFVALDYHRAPHDGLHLPRAPESRISPLEMCDHLLQATGRLHVLQHPDLLYSFLPIVWLTCRHDGVERKNLTYDSPVLDDFRNIRRGTFQSGTRKIPFHCDPHNVSALWFRHPGTGRIHEVPWRARHLAHAPLGDVVLDAAIARCRNRGGNNVLSRKHIRDQLIEQINQLTPTKTPRDLTAQISAARIRYEQSLHDHAEAALAAARLYTTAEAPITLPTTPPTPVDADELDSAWPDLA